MPSKIPPRSFRPGADRAAKMDAWALERGLEPHKAILALIDAGLGVYTSPPLTEQERARRKPQPISRWDLGLQFGPIREKPGLRLKGSKK